MCSTICFPWKCVLFRNTLSNTIDAPPRYTPRCQARTSAAFSQYWGVESTLDLICGISSGSRLFADMGGKGAASRQSLRTPSFFNNTGSSHF